MDYNPAIVVTAFNRPLHLSKLLKYLSKGNYSHGVKITLVISIDFENSTKNKQVLDVAKSFSWKQGDKRIIHHDQNLGLREHILKCGDLTEEYGAIILLEDDVLVAPAFYEYSVKTANYYDEDSNVAGISLYAYEFEELGLYRFYPSYRGKQTYFMQWAASWGQLWTRKQWKSFRDWVSEENDITILNIPDTVKNWSKSWKKYYIAYLVKNKKYFVYPFISYTTLIDEYGTHKTTDAMVNNVRLSEEHQINTTQFGDTNSNILKYDCFFQPEDMTLYFAPLKKEVQVSFDLFGTKLIKNITSDYVFTTKKSSVVIQKYSNKLIPYELNLFFEEHGNIFTFAKKSNLLKSSSILKNGNLWYNFRKKNSIKQMITIIISKIITKFLY